MGSRARKRDDNEPDIVKALQAVGAVVHRLDETGVPDLMVGWGRRTHLLEVKCELGPRGGDRSKLTPDQVTWHQGWKGEPAVIVRTPIEALRAIGAIK
jgi:hypothetical protein